MSVDAASVIQQFVDVAMNGHGRAFHLRHGVACADLLTMTKWAGPGDRGGHFLPI